MTAFNGKLLTYIEGKSILLDPSSQKATEMILKSSKRSLVSVNEVIYLPESIVKIQKEFFITDEGKTGRLYYDENDHESLHDGITTFVTVWGGRLKRRFEEKVDVRKFGAIADYDKNTGIGTDNTEAFNKCNEFCAIMGYTMYIPAGDYGLRYQNLKTANIKGEGMDKSRLFAQTSTETGFFRIAVAPLQQVNFSDFRLVGKNGSATHGMYLKGVAQNIPAYTGGVWYSNFTNITVENFVGNQWHIEAIDVNINGQLGDLANQFVNLTNCNGYKVNSTTSRSLYILGQAGQMTFTTCSFDGQTSFMPFQQGQTNVEIRKNIATDDNVYCLNFVNCTIQNSHKGIYTYSVRGVNLFGCYFENVSVSIEAGDASCINLKNPTFANGANSSFTAGLNTGDGCLLKAGPASFIASDGGIVIGTCENVTKGASTNFGFSVTNLFSPSGDPLNYSGTTIQMNSAGNLSTYNRQDILLNSSSSPITSISSALGVGQFLKLRIFENGTPNGFVEFATGGNIILPNGRTSVLFRANQTAVFVRQDLAGGWVLLNEPAILHKTSAPPTGTWKKGEKIYNLNPTADGWLGWVCISDGSPGVWKEFGKINL
ncbi:hypothetical protein [Flectobacillus sp. BAB-3569]|uniref:hypothetical protein n=1 Tax=Flectobacillus sp. BAB-3569 TaxID=1509483 RepID=UPI000BA44CF4|nr:hypothetical protein [Flectobacillus sp. BAB-3569]PAC29237.1 hypothetical protein BWI92_16545 [Flectobacillus sp. BAB-3569]